jgi:phosphate transport system permease protein
MDFFATFPVGLLAVVCLAAFGAFAWRDAFGRAEALAGGPSRLHSLPGYHGWNTALWVVGPAVFVLMLHGLFSGRLVEAMVLAGLPDSVRAMEPSQLSLFVDDARKVAFGGLPSQSGPELTAAAETLKRISGGLGLASAAAALVLAGIGFVIARGQVSTGFRARTRVEAVMQAAMMVASGIAILTTLGIVLSLIFETGKFFAAYSPLEFLFGTQWSPQVAIRADQVGQSGAFGAVPLFAGTALIMLIAMAVAVPVGLGSAIFLSEYADDRTRAWVKPALELLAGIPTVVYGFFALLTVAPFVRDAGAAVGLDVSAQSALAAGLVMGIMIIPFISSLSDDVINAVPQALRDGSFAMGATKSETIARVVLPAALPGIVGSVLLAVSRALGETMIVTMAAGQNANLSLNPLDMVTTVTVQIVTLLTGDQEYDSPKTHAAFALGFVLFVVTLILNVIALRVVQKYREKYD